MLNRLVTRIMADSQGAMIYVLLIAIAGLLGNAAFSLRGV